MNTTGPDVLRRYLLGDADPATRDEIERRMFTDDQVFWERLSIAEDDLIDDYAARNLESDECQRFESQFLCTDERRARLEFALALREHARQQQSAPASVWDWLRASSAAPRWALAVAATFALVLLPGLVWQFAAGGRAPAAITVSLAPGLLRGAGGEIARVAPAQGCQVLHLDLKAGGEPYAAYAATVYDVNGEALWSQHRLDGVKLEGAAGVRLTLPCELLPEGDYWVRLSGLAPGQEPTALDRYDFRVLRD